MVNIEKRLEFLIKKFNIFMFDEIDQKINEIINKYGEAEKVKNNNDDLVCIRYKQKNNKIGILLFERVFYEIINADPTNNKIYSQWMLNVLTKMLKGFKDREAFNFIFEDLSHAEEYLHIFDANKRKKLFKELVLSNDNLSNITDPSNINQYNDLSELFDAIDPFIEKNFSNLERLMNKFVSSKQALIPLKTKKFTLFIPLTTEASVIFEKLSSWCTARKGNGMFKQYTEDYLTSDNKTSRLYIIIKNEIYDKLKNNEPISNDDLLQIHFESNQVMDRSNKKFSNFYEYINEDIDLFNFFINELERLNKNEKNKTENKYVRFILEHGFGELIFKFLDEETLSIRFKNKKISKVKNLSRFKNLNHLILINVGLKELSDDIDKAKNLSILSLPNNDLKKLPKNIGKCKELVFINLINNPISEIPDEISELDISNGGNLYRISVNKSDIGEENYEKLRKLLPNTSINGNGS